jgi:transcriptional regulator with XRE-family HTH domain
MTIGKKVKTALGGKFSSYHPEVQLTTGEAVRLAREMNELSQNDLSAKTGLRQATISGIENNKISLGVERAKVLARALKVHPSVLLFPEWDSDRESAA